MSRNALPQIHIRPEQGWLNDPNGMVRHGGRWHVFFQHNPARPVHEHIAWGHTSSPDLVRWDNHPVAFFPTPVGPDRAGCWSGVYLPWLDRPAMAYSGVVDDTLTSTVCIREALDDSLDVWSDPYVAAETPPEVTQMRDPFCFEWRGRQFALLGARIGEATPAVLLYSCDDPRRWTYEGVWLNGDAPVARELTPADIWECPQLVEVDGQWTLLLSLQQDGRLSSVEYLIGTILDRDGLPQLAPTAHGPVDAGPDCYAPQLALDDDGPWLLGWILQDSQPNAPVTSVSGCMTLPRRLALVGDRLVSVTDPRIADYADTFPAVRRSATGGLPLPNCGRTSGQATSITLTGQGVIHEIPCPTGEFEVWSDGEVVEVYRRDDSPYTLRQPGTELWTLTASAEVTVVAVEPPSHVRPGAPRAVAVGGH
ncbi:glycoside hydrolase family 32 protein [Demetria terragena]|uniref:glycoside hydrolase family 32 protein n=1 Tax=Demetria terragena TaxID=63959 RepID=UPI00037176F8|nr:glycoside hydrolase family 32 protein [Demetria terragena]